MRARGRRLGGVLLCLGMLAGLASPGATQGRQERREWWGPFRGQVVDVETGQPIAGAVMLVEWVEVAHILGGHRFYEAREAVTDADGRFETARLVVPPWVLGVQAPTFHTFAPGYVLERLVVSPSSGEAYVDPTVLEMRRLKTREELRQKWGGGPTFVPFERMPQYLRAINEERRMLGLQPIGPEGGQRK